MKDDNTQYLLSLVAVVSVFALVLIYVFYPANAGNSRLHLLLIDCIPEGIVALVAIPIVYFFFYRRGLVGPEHRSIRAVQTQTDSESLSEPSSQFMSLIPAEVKKASKEMKRESERDVLIVVDFQHDFISGSLKAHDAPRIMKPLNSAIHIAESRGILVVFTKDWHPTDHCSFKENGGVWPTHCVMGTAGAMLPPDLYKPPGSVVFEFGVQSGDLGYSPLENPGLDLLISNARVRNVYVVGIALEYCVQAMCVGILERGKKPIALESAIATASDNSDEIEKVWNDLVKRGVAREKRIQVVGEAA